MQPEPLRIVPAEPAAPPTVEQVVQRLKDRPDAPAVPTSPLMTTDELAAVCQVSRRAIERWDAAGKVPGKVRLPGRLIRWQRTAVMAWIEQGCPAPVRQRKAR